MGELVGGGFCPAIDRLIVRAATRSAGAGRVVASHGACGAHAAARFVPEHARGGVRACRAVLRAVEEIRALGLDDLDRGG